MIRPLELFIGLRYTRARKRSQLVSFVSIMSTLGIVLGVAAMITVLSVMNGFGKELRHRILDVVSHVTVEANIGMLDHWRGLGRRIASDESVEAVAPYINTQGLLVKGRKSQGVFVRAIDPALEKSVSGLAGKMVVGKMDDLVSGQHGVILGQTLAKSLGVKTGSSVVLIHNRATDRQSAPRLYRLQVVGIFNVGMYQQDSGLAIMHIDDVAELMGAPGKITGLRIRLHDAYESRFFAYRLEANLGEQYDISHWMRKHSNFFVALEDQKRIMFLVLMLVVSVAAFNIVSTLIMMVTDKQSDIAILRTIGMSPFSVMKIFIFQGMLVATIGIASGVLAGVMLASNSEAIVHGIEYLLGFRILSADIYPITDLPSDIQLADIINIVIAAAVASFLSTLYPAWRAARTQPAQALRYE